jgi:DNA-binding beta-propeller fold protein YncE
MPVLVGKRPWEPLVNRGNEPPVGFRRKPAGPWRTAQSALLRNPFAALNVRGPLPADEALADRGINYSTYLGGTGGDVIFAIATREDGAVYLAGGTESLDIFNDGSMSRYKGSDGFVALLAPDGQRVLHSVVLGGAGDLDQVEALVLRGATLYAAGFTNSSDFPTTPGAAQREYQGNGDGFLVELSADDLTVTSSTFMGGSGSDVVTAVAADAGGHVFVAGLTSSDDFLDPSTGGFSSAAGDAFLLKQGPAGQREFGRRFGGSGGDFAIALGLDAQADVAVVGGTTTSPDLPVKGALQPEFAGGENDAFIAVFDHQGGALRSATYWGGSEGDQTLGIATDGSGAAYLVGSSYSGDFPVTAGLEGSAGEFRGFVVQFMLGDGDSLSLGYSQLLGGVASALFGTGASDIAVDGAGNPVIVGMTNSPDFPVLHAPEPDYAGGGDAFIAVLNRQNGDVEFSTFLGGSSIDQPYAVAMAGDAIYVAGTTDSTDFPAVAPLQGRPYGGDGFVTRIVTHPVASACLYVTSGSAGSVSVLDAARRRVTGVLAGGGALAPNVSAITVAPDGRLAYVLETGSPIVATGAEAKASVAVVDTTTGVVLGRFGTLVSPRDIFLSTDGAEIYVTDQAGLTDFDVLSWQRRATVPLSGASRAAVDPDAGFAYVLGDNGSHIYVIGLDAPHIVRDFALGPSSLALAVSLAPRAQALVVVESLTSQIVMRDTDSGTVRWAVRVGPGARSIALTPDERLLFVGHRYSSGTVSVVDMLAQRVVAVVSFKDGVDDVAVTPDGAFLYITTGTAQQVWVMDTKTLQIIGNIQIGQAAEQVAIGTSQRGCRVAVPCEGDCNSDGDVKIDELVTAVGILLGTVEQCACASLAHTDPPTIDYLVGAVRASLEGCPTVDSTSALHLTENATP